MKNHSHHEDNLAPGQGGDGIDRRGILECMPGPEPA